MRQCHGRNASSASNIDIKICSECGGPSKVVTCIEDQDVINNTLTHINHKTEWAVPDRLPQRRAPPLATLFD